MCREDFLLRLHEGVIEMTVAMSITRYSREDAKTIVARLKRDSFDDLNRLFSEGRTPSFDEIEGETASGLLAWNPQAPWWSKLLAIICFDNPLSRWAGKIFIEPFGEEKVGEGVNQFNNRIKPRRFPFVTCIEKTIADQKPCLRLDYTHFPGNLLSTRDELRSIDNGVFLGRAYSKLPWDKEIWFLRYFVVCALSEQS